jgi:hypothetical protein
VKIISVLCVPNPHSVSQHFTSLCFVGTHILPTFKSQKILFCYKFKFILVFYSPFILILEWKFGLIQYLLSHLEVKASFSLFWDDTAFNEIMQENNRVMTSPWPPSMLRVILLKIVLYIHSLKMNFSQLVIIRSDWDLYIICII